MSKHHADKNCYCDRCCDTADLWWEWRTPDGATASGPRYWTRTHALQDAEIAKSDGFTLLTRQTAP